MVLKLFFATETALSEFNDVASKQKKKVAASCFSQGQNTKWVKLVVLIKNFSSIFTHLITHPPSEPHFKEGQWGCWPQAVFELNKNTELMYDPRAVT